MTQFGLILGPEAADKWSMLSARSWAAHPLVISLGRALLMAAGYLLAIGIGQSLAFHDSSFVTFWPSTGLLVGALLLTDAREWPALLVGAAVASLTFSALGGTSPALAVAYALADLLEAVVPAWLVRYTTGPAFRLDRVPPMVALGLAAALVGIPLGATLGVGASIAAGRGDAFWDGWLMWWLGGLIGTVLVAPLTVAVATASWHRPRVGRGFEAAALAAGLGLLSLHEFGGLDTGAIPLPSFLLLPFPLWAAARFGPATTACVSALLATATAFGASHGHLPPTLVGVPFREQVLWTQVWMVLFFPGVQALAGTLAHQRQTKAALLESERRLALAIDGTGDGLWDWDIARDIVFLAPRFEEILGYAPGELGTAPARWGALIHPDDLLLAAHAFEDYLSGRTPAFELEYRLLTRTGAWKWVLNRGKVVAEDGEGHAVRMVGAITDLERLKATEAALRASEERFDLAMRGSMDGFWVADLSTGQVAFSPRALDLLGYTATELSGTLDVIATLTHPDDMERVAAVIGDALRHGTSYETEYRLRVASGRYRWFQFRGIGACNQHGVPVHLAGSLRDVTARRSLEEHAEALRRDLERRAALERRVASVLNSSVGDAIYADVLGLARDELDSRHGRIAYLDDHGQLVCSPAEDGPGSVLAPAQWQGLCAEALETRRLVTNTGAAAPAMAVPIRYQGGAIGVIQVEGRDAPYDAADRQALEHIAFLAAPVLAARDEIARRQRAEADLAQARDAALASTRTKGEFLAAMSHEIRTPMNGVIGMTSLLLDTQLDDEQRRYADTVRTSAEALLAILNDILDFSKIEAGRVELETTEFDLRGLVEDAVDLLTERAQAKDLDIVALVDPSVPRRVSGDPTRVRQVLVNLLGNAVKFTSEGGVAVRVRIETEAADHALLRFDVRDTGIGIPADVQPRLFQSFSQADSSTTRRYGGTGLGLAICRQLVELMGGAIGLQSVAGAGSVFWFTVRVGRVAGAETTLPDAARIPSGRRVLCASASAPLRAALAAHLQALGLTVDEAPDAAVALELLVAAARDGTAYHVLIADDRLRAPDGGPDAAAIAADPRCAGVAVVLLCGAGGRGAPRRSIDILRPVREAQLLAAVLTALGVQQAAPEARAEPTRNPTLRGGPRILVAEDNPVNQTVARAQLARLGCRVDVVSDGREAVDAVARVPYDLVLMDCQMPEMDGFAATRAIRAREIQGPRTPIIAMTANAMAGDRELCLAAGMDDYLSKPVKATALREAIERWARPGPVTATDAAQPAAD
ncbi:MAG: PAS domain-containing protein [Candidatus Binatia bacterium]